MLKKSLISILATLMLYFSTAAQTKQSITIHTASEIKQITTFQVNTQKSVADIAFSPDQKLLAIAETERSADLSGTVRVWDITTFKELSLPTYNQLDAITVAFSSDSKWFAAAGRTGEITIIDTITAKVVHTYVLDTSDINKITFSPDGKQIAVASGLFGGVDPKQSGKYAFRLIDVENGNEIFSWLKDDNTYCGTGLSVAFSPNGKMVAFGQTSKYIQLWDVETGNRITVLSTKSSDGIFSLAFSLKGDLLASGDVSGKVTLWDTVEWQNIATFDGGMQWYSDLAFSSDGSLLATTGSDGNIRLFDVKTQEEVAELKGHTGSLISLAFSPDGTLLASGGTDGTVRLWGVKE